MAMTPDGWERHPLQFVAKIGAGDPAPQEACYYTDGIHPFVRTQDVGRVGRSAAFANPRDRVNDSAIREKRLRLWPIGTTLVPKSGASTVLNHRVRLAEPAYVASHLATVVPRDGASDSFLYHVLCRLDAGALVGNSGYPSLSLGDLGSTPLLVPPLAEQRRIAAVLDAIGEMIEASVAVVEATERAYEALLDELLTRGFPGRHASQPSGWTVVELGEIASLRTQQIVPTDNDRRPYVALEHIETGGRLLGYSEARDAISHKTIFQAGDTLYGKLRPNLRKVSRVDFDGVCSTDILALFAKNTAVDDLFIPHLLRSDRLHAHAMRGVSGTKMPRTSWGHLQKYAFPLPPLAEQRAIATVLDAIREEIKAAVAVVEALQKLEGAAREALLTGRVRVSSQSGAEG